MNEYQVEVKNVGSGLLFIVLKHGVKVYEHLVTLDMLLKAGEENGQREEIHPV